MCIIFGLINLWKMSLSIIICQLFLNLFFFVVWQVGKQHEIEEAGHNPQILAQHGILLDTNLHQDTSSLSASRENRRWETKLYRDENSRFFFLVEGPRMDKLQSTV